MKAVKRPQRESVVVGFLYSSVDAMEADAIDFSGMKAVKPATEQALSISLGHDGVVVVATWPRFVN